MFRKLRIVMLLGALLVSVASAFRYFSAQTPARAASETSAPAAIETARVDRGDVALFVNATGNIQAQKTVSLAFGVAGKVTSVNVQAGDYVLKGQTIATMDDQAAREAIASAQLKVNQQQLALNKLQEKPRQVDLDVAQAAVKQAEGSLSDAKVGSVSSAQIDIAKINVQMAQNQAWQAQLNRDVTNQKNGPSTPGVVVTDSRSGKAIDSAQAQVTVAQNQLKDLQSRGANVGSIDAAQASLTSAQIQLQTLVNGPSDDDLKQAQANLAAAQAALDQAKQDAEKTKLVAPFAGPVAQVNLQVGQQAPTSQAVTLLDVSSFYVDLPISELDIAKIQVGQPVVLRFDSMPAASLNGKVSQISDTANAGTPVTYTVRVEIDPAGQPLLAAMSTTASVVTSHAANVVRLPNRFIRLDRQRNKAYATLRQPDGSFKEVEIQLGMANDTYTEIKAGLNVGDVVAAPQASASQGRGGFGGPGGGPGGIPFRQLTGG